MFYVEFPSADKWEKEKRGRYEKLVDMTGLRHGSFIPIIDGMIRRSDGAEITYMRYLDLFKPVPTYRGFLYEQLGRAGSTVEMDLCLENGLLVMPRAKVELILSPVELSDVEGGGTLVLCRWGNVIMQVIISVEGHFINLIK